MVAQPRPANAVARHYEPEKFTLFAEQELAAAPLWVPGQCFNPACGCAFTPARSWQIYCSTACERVGTGEFRRWGHKMALPLLAWRLTKYAPGDSPAGDLARASRRYITQAQSAWVEARAQAAAIAKGGRQ